MTEHSVDVDAANFDQVVMQGSARVPVVIDFWAPWCGPCRSLKPILEKLAAEYAGRFILAKVNSDENPELSARFGVRSIPAVKAVFNGAVVDEFVGAQPESQVRTFLDGIMPSQADRLHMEAAAQRTEGRIEQALATLNAALSEDARHAHAQMDRLEILVELQRNEDARAALAALDPLLLGEQRVAACKARLEFAQDGADADRSALEGRIASEPGDLTARLALAKQQVRAQEYESALEQLLEIVRRDRKFGDDIGRKTMLEVFNLLGSGSDLVSTFRKRLAGALY
jgi:putative thioredoxin